MQLFRRKPDRLQQGVFREETQVLLGRPAEPPSEAKLTELRRAAARHPSLRAVYLTQRLLVAADEQPTILLGLVLDDSADSDAVAQDIGESVHPLRPGDPSLDFELLEDAPVGDIWERVY